MAGAIIIVLFILYVFGYISIPGINIPNPILFTYGNHVVTLFNLLIFLVIIWAIDVLPSPLRQIAVVLVLVWLLSTLGFIALAGLSNIVVVAILLGLVISLFL
jgi:hypothetical protein